MHGTVESNAVVGSSGSSVEDAEPGSRSCAHEGVQEKDGITTAGHESLTEEKKAGGSGASRPGRKPLLFGVTESSSGGKSFCTQLSR